MGGTARGWEVDELRRWKRRWFLFLVSVPGGLQALALQEGLAPKHGEGAAFPLQGQDSRVPALGAQGQ